MVYAALTILALSILGLLAAAGLIARALLCGRRQPVSRSPRDCGLAYEDVAFPSKWGLKLKGWWIPAEEAGPAAGPHSAVVLLHPLFGNRHGLEPRQQPWPRLFRTSVALLRTARGFHDAGYTVLAFDFRSHGESEGGLCGGGLTEDGDVVGAVNYVFDRLATEAPEDGAPRVGVVGFGLGAAAALAAAGREWGSARTVRVFSGDAEGGVGWSEIPPANIKRLRFLVAVQPASLGVLLRNYLRRVPAPLVFVLVALVDRLCVWRGGYPLNGAYLFEFVQRLQVPVLYVQARSDPWGDCGEVQRLYEASSLPRDIWWIDEPLGRLDTYNYVGEHLERVFAFANSEHVNT